MPDPDAPWLAGISEHLRAPLVRCARGEVAPHLALMQLLIEARAPAEVESALDQALEAARQRGDTGAAQHLRAARETWRDHPQAWATVRSVVDGVEHGPRAGAPGDPVAHWAAAFDRAVAASPEGSVALYSLGSPDLLALATDEIVAGLREWGLLGPDRAVLDVGCGIGRFEAALAGQVGTITGIDVSGEMIATARARCAGLQNVNLLQCTGRDLAPFRDGSFDLVLAVDSFPYLVLSGEDLAARQVREAARVLRPRGSLVILNYSYRGDLDEDRRDVAGAAESRFEIVRNGVRPFQHWDGAAFHLVR